jgi:uncharacterized protein
MRAPRHTSREHQRDAARDPPRLRMMRFLLFLLLAGIVVIGGLALLLFVQQHALIYHPRRYPAGFERMLPAGIVPLEYTTAAGRQVAFYVPPPSGATVPTRLWVAFPGNASVALDWLYLTEQWPNDTDGFLLIDYPGYGRSEGRAGIESTRASAEAALLTLAARLPVDMEQLEPRLCVIGLSLGCAAGLDFAARHPHVRRIALLAPFTSMADVAASLFGRPAAMLLRENYDNAARLRELAARTPPPRIAIFHGTADRLIPIAMGRELAESAPGFVEFFPIEHATHDTIYGDAVAALHKWMPD